MKTICYFDCNDVCVAFDRGNFAQHSGGQCIDQGTYILPSNVCPIGFTAEQLWQYRLTLASTLDTNSAGRYLAPGWTYYG